MGTVVGSSIIEELLKIIRKNMPSILGFLLKSFMKAMVPTSVLRVLQDLLPWLRDVLPPNVFRQVSSLLPTGTWLLN